MNGVTSGHASAPSLYPIGKAVHAFDSKVREFHNAVNVFRDVVNALGRVSDEIAPKQAPEEFRAMENARAEAVAASPPRIARPLSTRMDVRHWREMS